MPFDSKKPKKKIKINNNNNNYKDNGWFMGQILFNTSFGKDIHL